MTRRARCPLPPPARVALALACFCSTTLEPRAAAGADPAAALEQLRQGYALKKADRCGEAIAHFVESERLDPRAKTLLNLADCEEMVDDLVSAQAHAVEARDRARLESRPELLKIATQRIAALDGKLPRLTITLARGAPSNAVVTRDGTALAAVSLGIPLPANPGPHTIVVAADGHADKRFVVVLVGGARETLEVSAGEALLPLAASPPRPPPLADHASYFTPRKGVSLALVLAGSAAVAAGAGFGFEAISYNNSSNANGHCSSAGCDATGTELRDTALRDATASTVLIAGGLAAVAGGVLFWATAPSSGERARTSRERADGRWLYAAPVVSSGHVGVHLAGAW